MVGCPVLPARLQADGAWLPDPLIMEERYLAVHVRGEGSAVPISQLRSGCCSCMAQLMCAC